MNKNILDTIGNTPLIEVEGIKAKLETTNPSGSVKDRIALYMTKKAEKLGKLKKGMKIIEVTSGNTGIAFAMISAIKGYKFLAIMPESMSIERRKMITIFGAKVILTPKEEDISGAIKEYNELVEKNPQAWLPKQFENRDNIETHEIGTGKEILEQTNGKIDVFVAGTGTGGTLIGIAKALKKVNPKIRIVGVEPAESPVISSGKSGLHSIQGIGEGFVPKIVQDNLELIDEFIAIKSEDAINASRKLAIKHGILVGISSGANFLAAKRLKKLYRNVVTIFPDRGERYLSTY